MKTFTITESAQNSPKVRVYLEDYFDIADAIQGMCKKLLDSTSNIKFILLREGDALPKDKIVWDSRNFVIDNLIDNKPKLSQLEQDMTNLIKLMGYVQNGTETSVTLFQDDATRSYNVRVGKMATYWGNTLHEAIEKAIIENPGD